MTKTELANMAIRHLGTGKTITDLDTEQSQEAKAIRDFYDTALRAVLSTHGFSFNRKRFVLNLLATDPNNDYKYAYGYPTDCVLLEKLENDGREENEAQLIPFKVERNVYGPGRMILTDRADAKAIYQSGETDPTNWPDKVQLAFSFYLAFLVGPSLGGVDGVKMADRALQLYNRMSASAASDEANQQVVDWGIETGYTASRY